ncbi:MAG: 23S rRNA (adenine(1618)-N(6))-methyltransferase RlmF [Cyclobacteriaceae bacterium]|jgi:23S rRNA (adenine1618-N6)-methyltransferase|nr:23S rRNA (adenine(1618)-N(6))-methyltransferase RlmF [Cyclobacteriaceae bacterium]
MPKNNKKEVKTIPKLHPRNRHKGRYDFALLIESSPELGQYVKPNIHGDNSIDFTNPLGVKELNKALLKSQYDIEYWEIPENYLVPPIPGRADYIHHMADLLRMNNYGKIPTGKAVTCLDIGVGASCIYPIIGTAEYGWNFIGSDIDPVALKSSLEIINNNPFLNGLIELKLQENVKDMLYGIITKEDRIDFSICNPPFHNSVEEQQAVSTRKVKNLSKGKVRTATLNFGGQANELWYEGGERKFIRELIRQSKNFATSCFWYSTLVSKQTNLKYYYEALEIAKVVEMKTIPMGQGNKTSRILVWTFLTPEQQKLWKNAKWKVNVKPPN